MIARVVVVEVAAAVGVVVDAVEVVVADAEDAEVNLKTNL